MKKVLTIALAIAVATVFMMGCGSDDGGSASGACGDVCSALQAKCADNPDDFTYDGCISECTPLLDNCHGVQECIDAIKTPVMTCIGNAESCETALYCANAVG